MELIIYTGATDKTQAAVTSVTDTTPITNIEQLVLGDNPLLTLRFTDGTSYQTWSGANGYTFFVGLGTLDTSGGASYASTSTFSDVTNGVSGRISLNTQALIDAMSLAVGSAVDWTRYPTQSRVPGPRPAYGWFYLQVQVSDPSGNRVTYAEVRVPVLNRINPYSWPALSIAPTLYGVLNFPSITGLSSAGYSTTKLGGLTTANSVIPVGTRVELNFAVSIVNDDSSTTAGFLTLGYQLVAGTTATSWPLVGRPYDYNVSTNASYWQLVSAALGYQPASYNSVTGKFHRSYVYGSANAAAVSCDQIGTSAPA